MMIYGQGKGGSGKSKLINKIRHDFGESIVLCSPTASSAHDIGGNTFHRVCQLPILNNNKSKIKTISIKQCERIQNQFMRKETLIIEEMGLHLKTHF